MEIVETDKAAFRALATVNAPLRRSIDAATLLSCLRLTKTDSIWRPHIRAFFNEVGIDILMDMVIDRAITFPELNRALAFWHIEDTDSARWIREMASVAMADLDVADAAGDRLDIDRR